MRHGMVFALLIGLVVLGGCKNVPDSSPNAEGPNGVFKQATDFGVSSYEYRIDPPDQIIVHSQRIQEFGNKAPQTVGPDGKVTYPLIGPVYVAQMTPDEVATKLRQLMGKYYTDPDITVEVLANSKFITVFGLGASVMGKFPYVGRNTVISLMADAGINDSSWPERVVVNRPSKNARVRIDFTKVYTLGDMRQNYLLEEGDIVYLERDPLSQWASNSSKILAPISGTSQTVSATGNVVKPGSVN